MDWGEIDYLVVDAPPGTSDEHISIAQYLKASQVDGAVIVTTPQEVSLIDVRKEINFCRKVTPASTSPTLPSPTLLLWHILERVPHKNSAANRLTPRPLLLQTQEVLPSQDRGCWHARVYCLTGEVLLAIAQHVSQRGTVKKANLGDVSSLIRAQHVRMVCRWGFQCWGWWKT